MRQLINWKDRAVEHPDRYEERQDSGYVVHTPAPGLVIEKGTPQSATNFNSMDLGIFEAMLMASEATRCMRHESTRLDGAVGELHQVTLNNTYAYPHNSSTQTVQLSTKRNNKNYTIEAEPVSVTDGFLGDVEYSEKLENGFKVHFTGSAKKAVLNLYVRGGI